jgi:hypothetical protein
MLVLRNKCESSSHKEQKFMSDELSELQENAEHGRENPSLAPISVTMAILAVCVAIVSLMGHRSHTEELMMQNRATDQWSYYQAKNIRQHNYQMTLDLLSLIEFKDKEQANKVREKYQNEAERYVKEQGEIEGQAKDFESESARAAKSGPVRPGRSVSRNRAGDFVPCAAHAKANFLVPGDHFRRCRSRGRCNRVSHALRVERAA